MTTEDQIDQAERRETLENDRKVREAEHQRLLREGATFHQFAQAFADEVNQGRFAATGAPRVVGSTPNPSMQYPAASTPFQSDPVGTEPPLGIDINAMSEQNPADVSVSPSAATGASAVDGAPSSELVVPPTVDDVEPCAGAPSFSKDQSNE